MQNTIALYDIHLKISKIVSERNQRIKTYSAPCLDHIDRCESRSSTKGTSPPDVPDKADRDPLVPPANRPFITQANDILRTEYPVVHSGRYPHRVELVNGNLVAAAEPS